MFREVKGIDITEYGKRPDGSYLTVIELFRTSERSFIYISLSDDEARIRLGEEYELSGSITTDLKFARQLVHILKNFRDPF